MRLLAWNIRQGGGSRLPRITDALKRHDADIVVLSEYRGGPSAPRLVTALHALGYRHATTLVPRPSRNGVLVAARRPFHEHGAVDVGLPAPPKRAGTGRMRRERSFPIEISPDWGEKFFREPNWRKGPPAVLARFAMRAIAAYL